MDFTLLYVSHSCYDLGLGPRSRCHSTSLVVSLVNEFRRQKSTRGFFVCLIPSKTCSRFRAQDYKSSKSGRFAWVVSRRLSDRPSSPSSTRRANNMSRHPHAAEARSVGEKTETYVKGPGEFYQRIGRRRNQRQDGSIRVGMDGSETRVMEGLHASSMYIASADIMKPLLPLANHNLLRPSCTPSSFSLPLSRQIQNAPSSRFSQHVSPQLHEPRLRFSRG